MIDPDRLRDIHGRPVRDFLPTGEIAGDDYDYDLLDYDEHGDDEEEFR